MRALSAPNTPVDFKAGGGGGAGGINIYGLITIYSRYSNQLSLTPPTTTPNAWRGIESLDLIFPQTIESYHYDSNAELK